MPDSAENREWTKQVLKEYKDYQNPQVTPDIDIVWAISGRGAYSAKPTEYLLKSPEFATSDLFREDDRQQTDFAAQLVREITAARLSKDVENVTDEDVKTHGPILFYNATNYQNDQLREAVDSGTFAIPKDKVRIEKLSETDDPKDANSRTQFEKFPQELLEGLIANGHKIALVQARWHLPRIARTINADPVLKKRPLWENVNIVYFVSDKNKKELPKDAKSVTKRAIDIRNAVVGEGRRISHYSKTGTTSTKPRYTPSKGLSALAEVYPDFVGKENPRSGKRQQIDDLLKEDSETAYGAIGNLEGIEIETGKNYKLHQSSAEFVFIENKQESWHLPEGQTITDQLWRNGLDFLLNHDYVVVIEPQPGDIVGYAIKDQFENIPEAYQDDHAVIESILKEHRKPPYFQHFGIYEGNNQVLSKYDEGRLYKHKLEMVPNIFGTQIYFFRKKS